MKTMRFRPYLSLKGNVRSKKYALHVAIHLPPNLSAIKMVNKGVIRHNGKDCDGYEIEIDQKANGEPCGIFIFEDLNISQGAQKHIVVKRIGINGTAIPDPDEGAVANYEDPDGDF